MKAGTEPTGNPSVTDGGSEWNGMERNGRERSTPNPIGGGESMEIPTVEKLLSLFSDAGREEREKASKAAPKFIEWHTGRQSWFIKNGVGIGVPPIVQERKGKGIAH